MIDYIKGQIIELTPTELILECGGIGYSILISLQTYEKMQLQTQSTTISERTRNSSSASPPRTNGNSSDS